MHLSVCLLLGLDPHSGAIAQSATRLVFPGSVVKTFNTLEKALKCEAVSASEHLVLGSPDKVSAASAVEATDATRLRRWAIVILGTAPAIERAEIVSPEEWSEPLLARVFRSAVALNQLMREKARLAAKSGNYGGGLNP